MISKFKKTSIRPKVFVFLIIILLLLIAVPVMSSDNESSSNNFFSVLWNWMLGLFGSEKVFLQEKGVVKNSMSLNDVDNLDKYDIVRVTNTSFGISNNLNFSFKVFNPSDKEVSVSTVSGWSKSQIKKKDFIKYGTSFKLPNSKFRLVVNVRSDKPITLQPNTLFVDVVTENVSVIDGEGNEIFTLQNISVVRNVDFLAGNLYHSVDDWAGLTFNLTRISDYEVEYSFSKWDKMSKKAGDLVILDPSLSIFYHSPSPSSWYRTSQNSILINTSITGNMTAMIFEHTTPNNSYNYVPKNYTFMNNSLVLALNFDNITNIGEGKNYSADFSGHNNNMTCMQTGYGIICNYTAGKYDKAINFNGTVYLTNQSLLNGLPTGNQSRTIEAWIYRHSPSNEMGIIQWGTPANWQMNALVISSNNPDSLYFYDAQQASYDVSTTGDIPVDEWTYIAMTYNLSHVSLYLNGVLDTITNRTLNTTIDSHGLLIGTRQPEEDYEWNGSIDEVRIWNVSLDNETILKHYKGNLQKYNSTTWYYLQNVSASENNSIFYYQVWGEDDWQSGGIQAVVVSGVPPTINFNSPTPSNNSQAGLVFINLTTSSPSEHYSFVDWNYSLVAWYRMNGETGENSTYIRDWSTWNNSATCSGTACPSWTASGKWAGAFSFDGVNDYFDAGNKTEVDVNNSFTLSVWIKPNNTLADGHLISKTSSAGSGDGWSLYFNGLTNRTVLYGGSSAANSNQVFTEDNQWVHVALTYDLGNINFYRNGVNAGSAYRTIIPNRTASVNIGSRNFGSTPAHFFDGTIDDVIIFKRALTPSEVSSLYNASANQYYSQILSLFNNQNYSFQGVVEDVVGNVNVTEIRNVFINTSNITSCGVLDVTNGNYTLMNGVSSSGTCFNITANSVTLECNGFMINYSQKGVGYGINNIGVNYTTIKNCNIVQNNNSVSAGSYGIYLLGSSNFRGLGGIINNTINTTASTAHPIYVTTTSYFSIINNTLICKGATCDGVTVSAASRNITIKNNWVNATRYAVHDGNTASRGWNITKNTLYSSIYQQNGVAWEISDNTIQTGVSSGHGIFLSSPRDGINVVKNNNVTTTNTYSYGISVYNGASNNTFINNTILTTNSNSHGIIFELTNSFNNTFKNMNVKTMGTGSAAINISHSHHNFSMEDSILNASSSGVPDIYVGINVRGVWNFTNVNYTDLSYNQGTGNLLISYYVDVNVTNQTNISVQNANVTLSDVSNNISFNEMTDSNGLTTLHLVYTHNMTTSNSSSLMPLNITVTNSSYKINNTYLNITDSKRINIKMTKIIGLGLLLNSTADNITFTYSGSVNASSSTETNQQIVLYRNSTNVTTENNLFINLSAGSYNYTAVALANQDYPEERITRILTINKLITNVGLLLNSTADNITFTYRGGVNASFNTTTSITVNLYRNNTLINNENNTFINLSAGNYNYTALILGNENYTEARITRILIINKSITNTSLYINGTRSNLTINASLTNDLNITAILNNNLNFNITLYLKTIFIARNTTTIYYNYTFSSNGLINFTAFFEGNQNYTASQETWWINVSGAIIPANFDCEFNNISFTWAEIKCALNTTEISGERWNFSIKDQQTENYLIITDLRTGSTRLFNGIGEERDYNISANMSYDGQTITKSFIITGGDNMLNNLTNLGIFGAMFLIGIVLIYFMHKFKEDAGSSIAYGFFAMAVFSVLGTMFMFGFQAITGITSPVNINKTIGLVCYLLGIYSAWFSTSLLKYSRKQRDEYERQNEFNPQ